MNSQQLSRRRHEYRKRIPSNMSWLQLDEAVYRYVVQHETYCKLADDIIRIYISTVAEALHVPVEFIELSVRKLIKEQRLAPYEFRLISMKRANALGEKHGRGVNDLLKYPTPPEL